ncbi:MAG: metallophosphoesterase, partial [Xanthomonadales bacterium]|nr:metallophosphoesterase [Xanthomonadales bacterium]
MALKVIQISDCHLSADPARPYRGENADRNLERVWNTARSWLPDLVLLTGDLSEDGSAASYRRLSSMLGTQTPILALPGNHDSPGILSRHFPRGPWQGPFIHEQGDWSIVLLDSTRPGRVEGYLSGDDMDALEQGLERVGKNHILLALHHQPVP